MKSESLLAVLVVEDDPHKKQKLFDFLSSRSDLFEEPEVCISTSEAIKRMQSRRYDLLILDIVIPSKPGGDPSEQHSLDLLDQLDAEHDGVMKPRYVLPISSASNLSSTVREFFAGRPWGVVPYQESSAQALLDIESVSKWISLQSEAQPNSVSCDVFVIVALEDPEFLAVESAFGDLGPLQPLDSKQLVRIGEISTGARRRTVATAFCPRMGPVAAALLTYKAIEKLRPKMVLMVGICAGLSDKVGLGDVVAAEVSWDWQSGKHVDRDGAEDFLISPHQLDIDMEMRTCLLQFKRDTEFWSRFATLSQDIKLSLPKLVLGPVATGASVLADSRIAERIREEQNRSVVGLDMETYGVYAAVQSASYPVRVLSLKAVCDKGDRAKDDKFQTYSAKISAEAGHHFISKYAEVLLQ